MNTIANNLIPTATDADLAKDAAAGSEAAFKQIYRTFGKPVRSLIYRLLSGRLDQASLDDLTQDVFVKAFRRIGDLRQGDTLKPWILRIAVNIAVDHMRRPDQSLTTPMLKEPAVASEVDRVAMREVITKALTMLDPDHRTVLVMRDFEQLSEGEVATVLQVPVGTVKSRLFNARAHMRQHLKSMGVTEESE